MKTQIRHNYLKQRDSMENAQIRALGARIRSNFKASGLSKVPEGASVMLYASFRNEADTWGIIDDLTAAGVTVLLSRTRKAGLEVYEYKGRESLKRNSFGILDPDPEVCPPGDLEKVSLVIVPGVVFDRRGGRVGFGAGYYDRFLPKVPQAVKVGLCYENQIIGNVPTDDNDIPMDYLLTEEGLFNCRTQNYTSL